MRSRMPSLVTAIRQAGVSMSQETGHPSGSLPAQPAKAGKAIKSAEILNTQPNPVEDGTQTL